MIWREKRILLLVLGLLLLGNVVFFLTYRVQYQSRLDEMDQRLEQAKGQFEKSKRQRAEAELGLQAYGKVERDVQQVVDETWSTQARRLTAMIAEVKRLAVASNAVPRTLTFGRSEAEEKSTGPARRAARMAGVREVSIAFSVSATYDQVRRMINLFELSNQFVIIDQISLAAADANLLTLNLRLKTVFREDTVPPAGKRM
jgi:Tfp pilus assembly protein PilO